ncbi:MAG: VWA domain-containing protein [Candidatus Binataceae bacterium]
MTPLREQLGRFIAELRTAGVRISVAESIDAMNAVASAGLERDPMREALAATLIKDEADRVVFDDTFGRFFAAPARRASGRKHPDHPGVSESAATGQGKPGENPSPNPKEHQARKSQTPRADAKIDRNQPDRSHDEPKAEKDSDKIRGAGPRESTGAVPPHHSLQSEQTIAEQPGIEGARLAQLRAIERLPFSGYTDLEYDQARDTLKPLERRFRIRLGRRLHLARTGRIDFRRTIRAAIQHGGALADLRFRARRPRHVDLLILADVSGSVRYAAELMLELVAGARTCFRRVASFVYIDRLAEAGFEQGHLVTSPPLDMYARSDFGRVLTELWNRRAELLNRQTLVVILGDGRNNRRAARADLLREIARTVRAVIWLNPEEPARWGSGDSAIDQYRRAVTALYPSGNLQELQRALLAAC